MGKVMRISISSPPDREKLVAEILFDDEQWAELNQDGEHLQLELYPCPSAKYWQLDYEEAIAALLEARKRLMTNR